MRVETRCSLPIVTDALRSGGVAVDGRRRRVHDAGVSGEVDEQPERLDVVGTHRLEVGDGRAAPEVAHQVDPAAGAVDEDEADAGPGGGLPDAPQTGNWTNPYGTPNLTPVGSATWNAMASPSRS